MSALAFAIVGFGIANALAYLSIFSFYRKSVSGISDADFEQKVRDGRLRGFRAVYLGRLVRCHTCTGYWVGVFLAYVTDADILMTCGHVITRCIAGGFFLSCTSFFMWLVARRLGAEEL